MNKRLGGKVAVVTGSGRGLGRAEALAFATEGAKVVVNDLGGGTDGKGKATSPADEVVAEIKKMSGEAVANYDSVTTPEGGERIIKTALDAFGRLDILVNNAGILRDKSIYNMAPEDWDAVLKVHLYGTFYCTRPACAWFRQQRSGRIINTSSHAGRGNRGQANYSAAKEGIVGFTRTVALDMGRYGVTCNAIRPVAATRLTLNPELMDSYARMGIDVEATKAYIMKNMPEDVASLVVFLATDEAANINGRVFTVQHGEIGLECLLKEDNVITKDGSWTVEELVRVIPTALASDMVNPAPAERG